MIVKKLLMLNIRVFVCLNGLHNGFAFMGLRLPLCICLLYVCLFVRYMVHLIMVFLYGSLFILWFVWFIFTVMICLFDLWSFLWFMFFEIF